MATGTTDRYNFFSTAGYYVLRAKELEMSAWKKCDVYKEIKVE